MTSMFTQKKSPFFNSASHFPLPAIPLEDFRLFIRKKFMETEKTIAVELIDKIYKFRMRVPIMFSIYVMFYGPDASRCAGG